MAAPPVPPAKPSWKIGSIAFAGALFIRALRTTVRLSLHGDDEVRRWEREGKRYILAFWHRHLLLMRYAYRGNRVSCLISQSKDGELIARVMEHFAVYSARGSSSRAGAAGLKTMIRLARNDYDLAITPDGPRGPLRVVQPGVIKVAAATGLPIVPVALAASRCKALGSWDRFLVPLPTSRVPIVYGEPLVVARRDDPEAAARDLTRRFVAVEEKAESLAGHAVSLAAFLPSEVEEEGAQHA